MLVPGYRYPPVVMVACLFGEQGNGLAGRLTGGDNDLNPSQAFAVDVRTPVRNVHVHDVYMGYLDLIDRWGWRPTVAANLLPLRVFGLY
jgi:hypothetical protein